ncbi:GSCOCG00007726001-RA-CDS [Cotesia congregata]|nr:GSCOCG00007726001-RA-CDS [Cotesia congregata]
MWHTLLERKYLSASASCCKNLWHTFSGNLCFLFMNVDRSPASQYSITMYIRPSPQKKSFISTMCSCFNTFNKFISVIRLSIADFESVELSTHLSATTERLSFFTAL